MHFTGACSAFVELDLTTDKDKKQPLPLSYSDCLLQTVRSSLVRFATVSNGY